jgi:hypothetical protein
MNCCGSVPQHCTVSQPKDLDVNLHHCDSLSYFATDGLSVSQTVLALSPSGTHDHILAVVKTDAVWSVVGRPP